MHRAEKVSSIVLIAFGLFVAYYSRQYLKLGIMITPGAGFLPYWIGIALAVLGTIWFLKTLFAGTGSGGEGCDAGDAAAEREALRSRILSKFLPGVLLVILYAWLFERPGTSFPPPFSCRLAESGGKGGMGEDRRHRRAERGMHVRLVSYLLKVYLPTGTWFS